MIISQLALQLDIQVSINESFSVTSSQRENNFSRMIFSYFNVYSQKQPFIVTSQEKWEVAQLMLTRH